MDGFVATESLLDIDSLVDLAVALRDQMPCSVDKGSSGLQQEEVVLQNLFRLAELLLCFLEVEINVQGLDEVGDGVAVLVALLAHYPDEILELLLVRALVTAGVPGGDDGGSEVAEDPGAVGLDCVDVGGLEQGVGDFFAGLLVVEKREERPVDQPGALLQLGERVGHEAAVDQLLNLLDFGYGRLPLGGEDLAGQLAPGGFALLVVVGRLRVG